MGYLKKLLICTGLILSLEITNGSCSVFAGSQAIGQNPNHVTEEYEGKKQPLQIEAEVVADVDSVYAGTLEFDEPSLENGKKLYGSVPGWKKSDFMKEGKSLEYDNQGIYLYARPEEHSFYFEVKDNPVSIPKAEIINEQEALDKAQDAISVLDLNAEILGSFSIGEEPEGLYSYMLRGVIEKLPIAAFSKAKSQGQIEIAGSDYSYVAYIGNMKVKDKKEIKLQDFSKILDKVQIYAKAGYIQMPESGQKISRISLEYYVQESNDGINFRPIWNFQVPYIINQPQLLGRDTDDLFYLDATSGMLVETMS